MLPMSELHTSRLRSLRADEGGAAMLEYIILTAFIAFGGAIGLTALGVSIAKTFQFVRSVLLSPIP